MLRQRLFVFIQINQPDLDSALVFPLSHQTDTKLLPKIRQLQTCIFIHHIMDLIQALVAITLFGKYGTDTLVETNTLTELCLLIQKAHYGKFKTANAANTFQKQHISKQTVLKMRYR